jgi:hypothetical protein
VDALHPGQRCEIERVGQGEYRVSIVMDLSGADTPKATLWEVLLSCPVKDWWVEPDRSERTFLQPPTLFDG